MGTRHLIAVVVDGEFKVAQYGQWDGYPECAGVTVLEFCRELDVPAFAAKVRKASFYTKDELNGLQAELEKFGESRFFGERPALTRDTGAAVLALVAKSPDGIKLRNQLAFAGDSLFCEWAYVVDLDKGVLEVFKGFNQSPLVEGDRFFNMPGLEVNRGYHPVKLVKAFALDKLPTPKQFVKAFEKTEEVETA